MSVISRIEEAELQKQKGMTEEKNIPCLYECLEAFGLQRHYDR